MFQFSNDLNGCLPTKRLFPVGATVYQGQLLSYDTATTSGGYVIASALAAASPDTASQIMGICLGVKGNQPIYNATYKGDRALYTTTQADVAAYGQAQAEVLLVTPTTLIKAPIVKDTVGTAPARVTNTSASAGGTTITSAAIDTTIDSFSTAYCVSGANRGEYRKITAASTTSQVAVIPFPYAIAVGDIFTIANVVLGRTYLNWDSQIQGIDSNAPYTSSYWFVGYVHELNLEVAGQEYAVFTLDGSHLVIG